MELNRGEVTIEIPHTEQIIVKAREHQSGWREGSQRWWHW